MLKGTPSVLEADMKTAENVVFAALTCETRYVAEVFAQICSFCRVSIKELFFKRVGLTSISNNRCTRLIHSNISPLA